MSHVSPGAIIYYNKTDMSNGKVDNIETNSDFVFYIMPFQTSSFEKGILSPNFES